MRRVIMLTITMQFNTKLTQNLTVLNVFEKRFSHIDDKLLCLILFCSVVLFYWSTTVSDSEW